jgi:hypothetical protein
MFGKASIIGIVVIFLSFQSCKEKKVKVITSSDIYSSYSINHKASYFNVPPGMVSLFLDESKKGNKELKDLLIDVNQLSFLILNNIKRNSNESKYYQELNFKLDSIKFNDVAQINNSKEIIRVKVDKKGKHFNELVVIVSNQDALYCISFKGRIHSKKVLNLVKPENVVAITNLDRFKH